MDELAQIRKEAARKYEEDKKRRALLGEEDSSSSAAAPAAKPHVVGNLPTDKRQWTMGEYTKLLNTYVRVSRQKVSTSKLVQIDGDSAQFFQSFIRSAAFQIPRCGILFGTFTDGVTKVHTIYECAQTFTAGEAQIIDDSHLPQVTELAKSFNLQCVGWIASRPRQDYELSSNEVIKTAEFQSKFGPLSCFILVKTGGASEEISIEAFQVSDQCSKMYTEGLLAVHPTDATKVKTVKEVECVKEVEQANKGMAQIQQKSFEVDTHLFTVPVGIAPFESTLFRNKFVRINRPDHLPQKQDFHRFLEKRSSEPLYEAIKDFHVLVFLSQFIYPTLLVDLILGKNNEMLKEVLADGGLLK